MIEQTAQMKLETGEAIKFREHLDGRWQASAWVYGLSRAPDHHAMGASRGEAAANLQTYVRGLRTEAKSPKDQLADRLGLSNLTFDVIPGAPADVFLGADPLEPVRRKQAP